MLALLAFLITAATISVIADTLLEPKRARFGKQPSLLEKSMVRKAVREALIVGLLLTLPAVIAWVTGRPFIFPSLGPSAFSLVVATEKETPRRVIGGHLIGVLGGLAAYHAVSQSLSLTSVTSPLSISLLRIGLSGIVSVVLTSAGMTICRCQHPPACATTLIVSLGLLPSLWDAFFIMVAVTVMYGFFRVVAAFCPRL